MRRRCRRDGDSNPGGWGLAEESLPGAGYWVEGGGTCLLRTLGSGLATPPCYVLTSLAPVGMKILSLPGSCEGQPRRVV